MFAADDPAVRNEQGVRALAARAQPKHPKFDSPEAHLRLGVAVAELNQDQEAVREMRRAIQLSPDYVNAHYRLALLYRKPGREAESKAGYDIVRRLHAKEDGSGGSAMKP